MEFSEISRIKRTLRQVRSKIMAFNTNCQTLRANNNNNVDENYNRSLIQPLVRLLISNIFQSFYILELWTRLLNDGNTLISKHLGYVIYSIFVEP
jgi:hypothetical protein